MRRILVLAGLLGLMLALHALRIDVVSSATDPLTLAAIGFVVLAAFTVGELASVMHLPRITGYILGGIALGPQLSNVLSTQIVSDMTVFNKLALGLIALSAGLELDVHAVRRVWRTLVSTIALKIPLLAIFVGGTFYVVEKFAPRIGLGNDINIIALGALLATLGIGTSPAIALAIISESKAKGRLADLTLAISVVKDLVVVLILALVITGLKVFLTPDATFGSDALLAVGREIGLSVLVGSALGGLFILYLRFVHREMLIVIVATVLLIAEASHYFHLELLLLLIAAGFVVRNFSRFEHELLTPLNKVALPVFVVFFTTAGAGVDLIGTLHILPLALALVGGRMLAFIIAGRLGARIGGETPAIGRHAWKAYISQAGVTLGLVLIAAESFPELADAIRQTGMAVVALNLLIGPILLGAALRMVGEVPTGSDAPVKRSAKTSRTQSQLAAVNDPTTSATNVPDLATAQTARVVEPEMEAAIKASCMQHEALVEQFSRSVLEPLVLHSKKSVLRLMSDADRSDSIAHSVRDALASAYPNHAEGIEEKLADLCSDLRAAIEASPRALRITMRHEHYRPQKGDGFSLRWRKRNTRVLGFFSQAALNRTVPVRVAIRYAFEQRITETCVNIRDNWFRAHLQILESVRRVLNSRSSIEECKQNIESSCARYLELAQADFEGAITRSRAELITVLANIGAPEHPASLLRLSTRTPATAAALRRLEAQAADWRFAIAACIDRLHATAVLTTLTDGVQNALERHVLTSLAAVRAEIFPHAAAFLSRVNDLITTMKDETKAAEIRAEIEPLAQALYTRHDKNRFRGLKTKFRQGTQMTELRRELASLLEPLPEQLTVLGQEIDQATLVDPSDLAIAEIRFAKDVSVVLIDDLVPRIADAVSDLSEQVALGEERLEQAADAAVYGLSSIAANEKDTEAWRVNALEAINRVHERIASYLAELEKTLRSAEDRAHSSAARAMHDLIDLSHARRSKHVVRSSARETGRYLHRVMQYTQHRYTRIKRRLLGAAIRASRRRSVRDWLIRSGQTRLDATSMSVYLRRFFPSPDKLKLPVLYHRVFSVNPVDDPRLQTARKIEIDDLVSVLKREQTHQTTNALIIGQHGSGRTSLINIVEMRLAKHRILRLDPRYHRRREGLLLALANELGCLGDRYSVAAALKSKPLVVLIDDIEHYLMPTPQGISQLEDFLQLVVATSASTRWVLSIESSALSLLEQLVSLKAVFGRRMILDALSWREVRDVVETRARLSGLVLSFEGRQVFGRSLPWQGRGARDDYFKAVTRVSGGNIRAAILSHLRDVTERSETVLLARYPQTSRVPFADQIMPEALAVLSLLLRFGPMRRDELAEAMCCERASIDAAVLPLTDAEMILDTSNEESLHVPVHLENAIAQALYRQGLSVEVA